MFQKAVAAVGGRSVQDPHRQKNLFLIIKFYLKHISPGCILEFGSYKGGSAIFMATLCRELFPEMKIYALDTFAGMPATDKGIDAHNAGDFADTSYEDLKLYIDQIGLTNLHLVKGQFENTTPSLLKECGPISLAHIDCDIFSAVSYSYNITRSAMCPGGYIVFDDATVSSCIGATEVVEHEVVARDGLRSEQLFPHFVFRSPFASDANQ
nr:TylF/MycF/NovP-related O-methyltransferase [Methylorubrum extorquens]